MLKHLLKPLLLLLLTLPLKGLCQTPFPKWVDDFGGSGDSKPTGMISDKQNNVYVSGYFNGTVDFDPSVSGVKNLTSVGGYDIYVAKYDVNGTLIWATAMGGNALDQVNNMTVDANGNPTITGQFQSNTLYAGGISLQNQGGDDIFIIHLDANGTVLWGKDIGGKDTDRGEQISADLQGNLLSTAIFQSTLDLNGTTLNATGGFHGLISKYDSTGKLLWYINLGATGDNEVFGDGTDAAGDVSISGSYTGSVDFDPLGSHKTLTGGFNTPFVAKYTSAGKLIWVNTIAGNFLYNGSALSVDTNNDIYITAAFSGSLQFNAATSIVAAGSQDSFVAKYLSDGTFKFAADLGGVNASSVPYQIRNDNVNNVYVAGYFSGTIDFDPSPNKVANVTGNGQRNMFLSKLDKDGNYQYAFSAGSPDCDLTLGIELAVFNIDDLIVGGSFCSTVDFDPSICAEKNVTAQNGTSDSFVVRYIQGTAGNSQITAFSVSQEVAPAVIDQVNHTIALTVAAGTSLTALKPIITASNGGTLKPSSGLAQNFSKPVIYTDSVSCSGISYTVTVKSEITVNTDTVCAGASSIIVGDVISPVPTGYTWQVKQGSVWINAPGVINTKDYQTSPLVNSKGVDSLYHLRRKETTNGVIGYDSYYDVTVQPAAAITNDNIVTPAVNSYCATGDPSIITGSTPLGGNGIYTYQWQSSIDNKTFTNISGAIAVNYDPAALVTTTYFRRVVASGKCASPLLSNAVAISIFPAVANNTIILPAITAFCGNADPDVINGSTPTGGNGIYAYQWQSSTDGVVYADIISATVVNYNPPVINVSTYYRRLVTSGICNTPLVSNVVQFTIDTAPDTPTVQSATLCSGNSAILSIRSPQKGVSYQWFNAAMNGNLLATGDTFTTPVLTMSQTYYVAATNGSCIAPTRALSQVTVSSIPAQPVLVKNNIVVCSGSTATLDVSNPQAGIFYNWYTSSTGGTAVFTGPDFVTPAVTATITYYVEATNGGGCASMRTVATISPNPLPVISTTGGSVCPGSTAVLTATSDPNTIVNWFTSSTGGTPVFTGLTFTTPTINANVVYYAEATDQSTGCTSPVRAVASVQLLKQLDAPEVTTGDITTSSVSFNWAAIAGATDYQVSIDGGKTFVTPSSGTNGLSHTVTNLKISESVTILVRAEGISECQQSDNSIAVTATAVSPLGDQIFVPNAFTPNSNGKNDVVYVRGESIKSLKFYVYDQWGELLYMSSAQLNGWDGTYKGAKEPVGVYVYFLEAVMNDGQKVNKKGTITLIR